MATPEPTLDRGPAPFAQCTACRVGFEVPDDVWAKGYREVRCGSCNVKFDLLEGIEAARARMAGETMCESGEPDRSEVSGDDASIAARAGTDGAPVDMPEDGVADGRHPDSVAPGPALDAVRLAIDEQDHAGFERYLYDDLELDQTVTDFDLFSEEAGLPEVAYFERFDAGSFAEADEAEAALLKDPEVSLAEADPLAEATADGEPQDDARARRIIADVPPEQPLVFDYDRQGDATRPAGTEVTVVDDADTGSFVADDPLVGTVRPVAPAGPADTSGRRAATAAPGWRSARERVPALLRGILILAIALAAFGGWMVTMHQQRSFYNNGFWRPAVLVSCRVFTCTVPSRIALDQLVLIQRNVYSHPSLADALVLNVSFRNEATFAQRYPVLVVRFSDSLGRPVARRNFRPDDYLDDWQPNDVLEAGRRLDINLEIDDPDEAADSFEINFRAS